MSDQVSWIKRLNQRIIENLTEERSGLLRQLEEMRKRSDEINRNLSVLDAKKDQILAAEKLQIDLLSSTYGFENSDQSFHDQDADQEDTPEVSGRVKEIGKLKARIGDQRYSVLEVFRSVGATTLDYTVYRTRLPERRVRDAIVADLNLGVLELRTTTHEGNDVFALTEVGLDLMKRFDEYRRQKGLPLPVLPELDTPLNTTEAEGEAIAGGVFN